MKDSYDALLSYSSKDQAIADRVLDALETGGVRCWMAPRNIQPGDSWAGAIMRAIRSTDVFVLILTSNSNHSRQVLNEVERARHLDKPIVCYRAEAVTLSDDLEYFISSIHWIEAEEAPTEALPELVTAVRSFLPVRAAKPEAPKPIQSPEEIALQDREQFLQQAKKAYLDQAYPVAHDYFTEAAKLGSGEAWFYLGEQARKGEGIKTSPTQAKRHYQKAVAEGSNFGYYGLARLLEEADELPARVKEYDALAHEAIIEAAVDEDAYACYLAGQIYLLGQGVAVNKVKAQKYIQKSGETGYKKLTKKLSLNETDNLINTSSKSKLSENKKYNNLFIHIFLVAIILALIKIGYDILPKGSKLRKQLVLDSDIQVDTILYRRDIAYDSTQIKIDTVILMDTLPYVSDYNHSLAAKQPRLLDNFNNFLELETLIDIKWPLLLRFKNGTNVFTGNYSKTYKLIVNYLKKYPQKKIAILAFVENKEHDYEHYDLSLHSKKLFNYEFSHTYILASALKKSFISQGINSKRIQAIGRGVSNPIAPDSDPIYRKYNRRFEIYFYDN